MSSKDQLLNALKAAGEPTRLRLLALCNRGELSVSELTQIVGQSQPRVSRHLKMLVEGGLLERFREGTMVFYRRSDRGELQQLLHTMMTLLQEDDEELQRDKKRLEAVKQRRAEQAQRYFSENADHWNELRTLHVPDQALEQALLQAVGPEPIQDYLDIGTGTGRILTLLADRVERGMGLDVSAEMLNLARDGIEQQGYTHLHVRMGDMYNMPVPDNSVDLATLHMVLHYSNDPEAVLLEAARVLRPGGRLIVVDFAPHHEEYLRHEHQHFRLGFSDEEVTGLFRVSGLEPGPIQTLHGEPLSVKIWQGVRV